MRYVFLIRVICFTEAPLHSCFCLSAWLSSYNGFENSNCPHRQAKPKDSNHPTDEQNHEGIAEKSGG
jgi:hypothetical protein